MLEESRFSVIVPAHNASDTLADCLRAIFISSAHLDEVIVFNDGSTDDTLKIAQGFPVQVLTNRGLPVGPALGRNRCAAIAKSKILVFVDADVIVHRGAIETLVSTIVEDLTVVAAFGSYDDQPRSRQIAALYANLRHYYVHQNGQTNALTFWAGLGAIRQSAFQDVGRFELTNWLFKYRRHRARYSTQSGWISDPPGTNCARHPLQGLAAARTVANGHLPARDTLEPSLSEWPNPRHVAQFVAN